MSKDNKVQLPSSQGGLMRYDSVSGSSIQIRPEVVVVLCIVVMAIAVGLHMFL